MPWATARRRLRAFKVHLDGYDQGELLSGKGAGTRKEIFYFDAGGNLNAVRYLNWKIHFCLMEGDITQGYRKTPSWPIVVNLRQDPSRNWSCARRYVPNTRSARIARASGPNLRPE
jgi:arylsulfatase